MPKLLLSIIFIGFVLVFGIGVIWPGYQKLEDLQLKVSEKEVELQTKQEYFQNLAKISKELKDYQESLKKIDIALPQKPALPTLFNFLQSLASQTGLILKEINYKGIAAIQARGAVQEKTPKIQQKESSQVRKISLSLSLSGSYNSLKKFLEKLEKNARLFEINSISFSSSEEEEIFEFNLAIETHSY